MRQERERERQTDRERARTRRQLSPILNIARHAARISNELHPISFERLSEARFDFAVLCV